MTCEVCGDPTTEGRSPKPADEDYLTYVVHDDPDALGIGITEYEFCSLDCLGAFVPPNDGSVEERIETVWRDAAVVGDALDLPGEPFDVDMEGRTLMFKFPKGVTDDDD